MKTQSSICFLLAKKVILMTSFVCATLVSCSSNDDSNSDSAYTLDATSVAEWAGSSGDTENTGSLDVSSSDVIFKDGKLASGTFIMPVSSLKNFNIEDPQLREMLLNHLKSADFFDMALHPNLTFTVTKVVVYDGLEDEAIPDANFVITGNLKMLGVTQEIHIPAKIERNGNTIKIEGVLWIDRTAWGMDYATDPEDAEHYIEPLVGIHIKVKGNK